MQKKWNRKMCGLNCFPNVSFHLYPLEEGGGCVSRRADRRKTSEFGLKNTAAKGGKEKTLTNLRRVSPSTHEKKEEEK